MKEIQGTYIWMIGLVMCIIDMIAVFQGWRVGIRESGPAARDMFRVDLRPDGMPLVGYCLQVSRPVGPPSWRTGNPVRWAGLRNYVPLGLKTGECRPIGPHGLADRKPSPLGWAEESRPVGPEDVPMWVPCPKRHGACIWLAGWLRNFGLLGLKMFPCGCLEWRGKTLYLRMDLI